MAEELEEHDYRRALEVVANHHHRQAEKEASIHQQQLAQASRQRYFAALAAELKQQRQEELLVARRAEIIRSQRARARLNTAERQHTLGVFLRQHEGGQPACHICGIVAYSILISSSSQMTHQPHVVECRPLADALKQRLAAEFDTDITEPIQNILSSVESCPIQSEEPKVSGEDTAECQGHSHPKLLELKTQGCRVHNSSTLPCSQWFPGQRLFPSGYLSTNSYRTHFNCLSIKGLHIVGSDESNSSHKDERASTFSSIQVLGKSGGERSGAGVISRRSDPLGHNSARG